MPFSAPAPPDAKTSAIRNANDIIFMDNSSWSHGEGTVWRGGKLSLYQETRRMLAASYLMFILPDIRAVIRKGEPRLQGDDAMIQRVLDCPCTALDCATVFNDNLELIKKVVQDEERASMYNQSMDLENPDLARIHILCLDDEHGDEECVYSLAVNHPRKLVTVQFRGSVTPKDFVQDAKAVMADIENPLEVDDPKYLSVHLGFKQYLYEVLPWHDELLIPLRLKHSLKQSLSVVETVGKGILDVGTAGASTVGKGVSTVGRAAFSAAEAGASTVGKGVGMVASSVETVTPAPIQKGVAIAYSAAETGVGMVATTAGTGVTVVGTAASTGATVVGTAVGSAVETVTDFVGLSSSRTSNKETQSAETVDCNRNEEQSISGKGPISDEENQTDAAHSQEAGTATPMEEAVEVSMVGVKNDQETVPPNDSKPKEARKYEIIIDQLKQVFAEHPDYRLYVGGHSLGGALATVFAFECAATSSEDIPKPVTCITSGAPKVGNYHFLNMFRKLEEKRKLRCLHVANYRDVVPLSPPVPLWWCCGGQFRRVGIHLTLSPHAFWLQYALKRVYVLRLLVDILNWIRHFFYILFFVPLLTICGCSSMTLRFLRSEHTQLMYMNRFDNYREAFEDVTIDELYEERFSQKGSCPKRCFPIIKVGGKRTTMDDVNHAAAEELDHL